LQLQIVLAISAEDAGHIDLASSLDTGLDLELLFAPHARGNAESLQITIQCRTEAVSEAAKNAVYRPCLTRRNCAEDRNHGQWMKRRRKWQMPSIVHREFKCAGGGEAHGSVLGVNCSLNARSLGIDLERMDVEW
jgi:hypothetical protein